MLVLTVLLFCSVHLVNQGLSAHSRVFNVKGLLEQVHLPDVNIATFFFTRFQSPFADFYLVFNAAGPPPALNIEYTSDGSTWTSVPAVAMRPLSCSPGKSVFTGQSGLPLVHSCLCPFDRQLPLQPMCRSVRPWSCKYVSCVSVCT